MQMFGGPTGTPLWKDNQTSLKGKYIRATPCSPMFQRKMEVPIRVLLALINESEHLENKQVTILWKTLTIMQPQANRDFDPQAQAFARVHYFEEEGELKGFLEVMPELSKAMKATPPIGATEPNCWEHFWCRIVYGIQHEIDLADKDQFQKAMTSSQATGKGLLVGKGKRHWSSSAVYSSVDNPYPLDIAVKEVSPISFVWDEYCDKFGMSDQKVGSYDHSSFAGPPGRCQQSCTVGYSFSCSGSTQSDYSSCQRRWRRAWQGPRIQRILKVSVCQGSASENVPLLSAFFC